MASLLDPSLLVEELERVFFYPAGRCADFRLKSFPDLDITYSRAAELLISLPNPKFRSVGFWAVARCLNKTSTDAVVLADGRSLTKRQLYWEAYLCDPQSAFALNGLATTLRGDETIALPTQATSPIESTLNESSEGQLEVHLTSQQLYVEAIHLREHALFYNNLGASLSNKNGALAGEDPSIKLRDGRTLSQRALYLESLRCDPRYAAGCFNLASSLGPGEMVLLDGQNLSQQDLYFRALDCDRDYSLAYFNLGCSLNNDVETLTLVDGRSLNRRQFFLEAIRSDAACSSAYHNLACALEDGESICLIDGRVMSQSELFAETLRFNPKASMAYANIAMTLPVPSALFVLPDGRVLDQRQLLWAALELDDENSFAKENLVKILDEREHWSRKTHAILYSEETNLLFATLLLSLQRLETEGRLMQAHQSMVEDIFEGWTWGDERLPDVEAFMSDDD